MTDEPLARAMHDSSGDFPPDIGEPDYLGLKLAPSTKIAVPRLADAPWAMECKTWKTIDVNGDRPLIMGEGLNFYIRDELWDRDAMRVHMERYHPIGRMFADRYCRTDDRVLFPAAEGRGGPEISSLCRHRPMRAQERTDLAHRQRNSLLRLLPREHAHFRLRREHRGLHRDRIRMRRNIVRQDQHRRLATAHEIARHGEHEVGVGAVHLGQELIDLLHRDLGPALDQFRTPALHVVVVEQVAHLRARAARLRQHGGDDAIGRALQQIPDEGPADAEAEHHELVDAEMIHQAEMVVGVGIPRPIDLERAGGLAGIGVAQVGGDAAVLALEFRRSG